MSDLWSWSLRVYGRPGVAAACLEAQDRHRADVNLLLWAAWTGAEHGHLLTNGEVAAARDAVAGWHGEVVVAIRALRRRLKTGPLPAPDAGTEALRSRIKAVELEAERIEQTVLQSHPPLRRGGTDPAAALAANLRLLLEPDPAEPLIEALSAAIAP